MSESLPHLRPTNSAVGARVGVPRAGLRRASCSEARAVRARSAFSFFGELRKQVFFAVFFLLGVFFDLGVNCKNEGNVCNNVNFLKNDEQCF